MDPIFIDVVFFGGGSWGGGRGICHISIYGDVYYFSFLLFFHHRQIEGKVVEITKLQEVFAEKVLTQVLLRNFIFFLPCQLQRVSNLKM